MISDHRMFPVITGITPTPDEVPETVSHRLDGAVIGEEEALMAEVSMESPNEPPLHHPDLLPFQELPDTAAFILSK